MTESPSAAPGGRELTPAAEVLVDQFTADVRRRVLDASGNVQPGTPSDEIRLDSVREVLSHLTFEESTHQSRRERYLAVLSALAAAIIGVSLGVSTAMFKTGADRALLGAVSATFVALIAATIAVLIRLSRTNNWSHRRNRRVETLFLQEIASLEFVARNRVRMLVGEDSDIASLSDVLAALEKSRIWLPGDAAEFRALLRIRNSLLHQARTFSSGDLVKALNSLGRLSSELSRPGRTSLEGVVDLSTAALEYEKAVHAAIQRVLGADSVSDSFDGAFDYLVELPRGILVVEAKFRANGNLRVSDLLRTLDSNAGSNRPGLLIVTNVEVAESVRAKLASLDRNASIVRWRSPADDRVLRDAVASLSQSTMTSRSAGRVEISRDAAGKYRFTIKSRNGEMLAMGDAFETRAALLNAIGSVQSVLADFSIVDLT